LFDVVQNALLISPVYNRAELGRHFFNCNYYLGPEQNCKSQHHEQRNFLDVVNLQHTISKMFWTALYAQWYCHSCL